MPNHQLTAADIGQVVGYVEVRPGQRQSQSFETAAWFVEHEFEPGRYPVTLLRAPYGGYLLVALHVPTRVVNAFLGTLFGGVLIGADHAGQSRIGQVEKRTLAVSYAMELRFLRTDRLLPLPELTEAL